jgi:hypothetical protein
VTRRVRHDFGWPGGRDGQESGGGEEGFFDDEDSMGQDFVMVAGAWLFITGE